MLTPRSRRRKQPQISEEPDDGWIDLSRTESVRCSPSPSSLSQPSTVMSAARPINKCTDQVDFVAAAEFSVRSTANMRRAPLTRLQQSMWSLRYQLAPLHANTKARRQEILAATAGAGEAQREKGRRPRWKRSRGRRPSVNGSDGDRDDDHNRDRFWSVLAGVAPASGPSVSDVALDGRPKIAAAPLESLCNKLLCKPES